MKTTTTSAPTIQISRTPEARKARRIIRTQLKLASMAASGAYDETESAEMDEAANEMQTEVDEALEFLASIRRERKPKAAKKSKAEKIVVPDIAPVVVPKSKKEKSKKTAAATKQAKLQSIAA